MSRPSRRRYMIDLLDHGLGHDRKMLHVLPDVELEEKVIKSGVIEDTEQYDEIISFTAHVVTRSKVDYKIQLRRYQNSLEQLKKVIVNNSDQFAELDLKYREWGHGAFAFAPYMSTDEFLLADKIILERLKDIIEHITHDVLQDDNRLDAAIEISAAANKAIAAHQLFYTAPAENSLGR